MLRYDARKINDFCLSLANCKQPISFVRLTALPLGMVMAQFYKFIFFVFIALILTACAWQQGTPSLYTPRPTPIFTAVGAGTGAIAGYTTSKTVGSTLGGAGIGAGVGFLMGMYADSRVNMIKRLESHNVQVVILGDNVTVILPTDGCFYPGSPEIMETCEQTMTDLTTFLKSFGNVPITVTGYTDNVGSYCTLLILSRQQADAVVAYLWAHGIPFRQMVSIGKGPCCNIATNNTVVGSAENRHIEITLRQNV